VGKTRLAAELADRARRQGALALAGGCLDVGDGVVAYAPVVEALRPLPGLLAPEELESLARRARIGLRPAEGGEPEAPPPGEELGLTPREREVLGLVADGRSNRQIAEELFISAKTASVHVSNILAKLGVANRAEAAVAAHRLGLTRR
jgi:DNA-binding CsgD family transcriptional regulator